MSTKPPFYYFFCDHWTQGGIGYAFKTGWHKGRRYVDTFSSAYTIDKMLDATDQYPGLKIGLELDAHLYETVAQEDPSVTERLRRYIQEGKASVEGGTYSQPFGQDYGWEPNIRQLTYGRRAVRDVLATEARAFLVEEQWFHPQLPQLLTKSGFKYASLQNQNSGRVMPMPDAVIHWVGLDGAKIPTIPANDLMVSCVRQFQNYDEYKELLARYKAPLLTQWVEVWAPGYDWGASCTPFDTAVKQVLEWGAEPVGLAEYFDKVLPEIDAREVYLPLDESNYYNAWYQGGGWGGDGDRVIVKDKLAEQRLLALETAAALAALNTGNSGIAEAQVRGLWKRLFVLQNHDFSAARPYRTEYKGVTTSAAQMGNAACTELIADAEAAAGAVLAGLTGSGAASGAAAGSLTLFHAGGVPGLRAVALDVAPGLAVTQDGRTLAQQRTADGQLLALADLPAVGAVTLGTVPATADAPVARKSDATAAEAWADRARPDSLGPVIESDACRVQWLPGKRHAAITDKATGVTVTIQPFTGPTGHMNEHNAQFPSLNPGYKLYSFYFSATLPAPDWIPVIHAEVVEAGQVRSTLLLRQDLVTFHTTDAIAAFAECRISVEHATGKVSIASYLYAGVPLSVQCEAIFGHNIPGARYFRDFPFGEEETKIDDSYANTYWRVQGETGGFTLSHGGTQRARITRKADGGAIANLIARDAVQGEYHWTWTLQFGQHRPHESARLVKAAHAWTAAVPGATHPVDLVRFSDDRFVLSSVYREDGRTFVRFVNYAAEPVTGTVMVSHPFTVACFADFEGNETGPAQLDKGHVAVAAKPWEILTIAFR